ncbi:MAG: hypothetical protein KAT53_06825 [Dehalococcoidia bacterium]|nr:hypothetical protein [Dehalococcoidia bacterium]
MQTEIDAQTATPEWDSLGPVLQNNLTRQHREGGIKAKNIPLLKGKVDDALKPHTDTVADLRKQLAEVETALDKAELKADFVKYRDERRSLIAQIVLATEAKTKARTANKDNTELVHFRATARASEWMRMRQVTGILGDLRFEKRQESDDTEIAEFEHAQSVAISAAQVVGALDLDLFK